ncbi:MAG: thiamine biosynthesis protein [Acidimicrobiaceae bacterium]|nr:thiamine biosynthesis protein [Acidimicrobiaceae bacterium]
MSTVGAPPPAPVVRHLEEVMGTVVTFDVYADSTEASPELWVQLARARAVLQRADAVFSTWRPHSPMSRLRRGEISLDEAPDVVAHVLEQCGVARELSGGWFDPWAMPGGVDPTGYVKGWAAQRALAELTAAEISGVIVNAAGDVATRGTLPGGLGWRIGIVDPAAPRRLATVVDLVGSIATSGTYERGAHLVDPHSGRSMARAASASVCGPDLGLADALATALAVAGPDGLDLVERLDGYEAMVIGFDGARRSTTAFPYARAFMFT